MPKKLNPINKDEKESEEVVGKRVEPDIETDTFGTEEQDKIIKMLMDDLESGLDAQSTWVNMKKEELLHIHNAKPSQIEGLTKKDWMSDRNLGLMPGILDIYQATLLSTCYNPDSIHYIATEANDVDSKDNLTKFTKWGLGKHEANFYPEVDDHISNRVAHGFSCFKVYWEVKYDWIDKRIPVYSKIEGKKNHIIGYDIKTEERRFERGVIKNIDNIDDIIVPAYGKDIQDLDYFIERIHLSYSDLKDMSERGIIDNFDDKDFANNIKNAVADENNLRAKKLKLTGLYEKGTENMTNMPVDCYEWYGYYTKNGKRERYRFLFEPVSEKLLSGKPLRKVNRDGKIPYVGGPLRRTPGVLRGGSLIMLISNLINALNNNYNQTSDFQYVQNVPFGFSNLSETNSKGVYDLVPGVIYNVDDSPIQDKVYFPNLTRSLAWSYQDKEFIMQMIERLTGAASYFLTTDTKVGTATRDAIVNEKGETKFGLWVKRIQIDITEAINMWIALYQENAPRGLAERVLGKDGKRLFKSLSIDDLRGRYDARMTPDITNGSKVFERQVRMWGLGLMANSIWFDPQINPRGNWMITKEAMKANGYEDAENYLPPQPKALVGSSEEVENEFRMLSQGDTIPDPPEGITPLVVEHYEGHMQQKEDKYNQIPEEYRPNFDAHVFATMINYNKFLKQKQMEQQANEVARRAIDIISQAAKSSEGNAATRNVSEGMPPTGVTPPQAANQGMEAPAGDIALGGM